MVGDQQERGEKNKDRRKSREIKKNQKRRVEGEKERKKEEDPLPSRIFRRRRLIPVFGERLSGCHFSSRLLLLLLPPLCTWLKPCRCGFPLFSVHGIAAVRGWSSVFVLFFIFLLLRSGKFNRSKGVSPAEVVRTVGGYFFPETDWWFSAGLVLVLAYFGFHRWGQCGVRRSSPIRLLQWCYSMLDIGLECKWSRTTGYFFSGQCDA